MSLFNGDKETKILKLKPHKGVSELVPIGDIHTGAKFFDEARLKKTIAYVEKTPGCYAFLMGDLTENVTPGKGGNMLHEQLINPDKQIDKVVELLYPIRKKILGSIKGNHEGRTMKEALLDVSKIIADKLQIPYYNVGGSFLIKVGKEEYRAALQHGVSAGMNPLTELKRMKNVYADSELCALGHNHQLIHTRHIEFYIDSDGKEKAKIVHLVRTGTYLGYADYSREKLYMPPLIGSPLISFYTKEHKIEVDIDTLAWEVD